MVLVMVIFYSKIGPAATIFGSARFQPDNPYYQATIDIAKHLAIAGMKVIIDVNQVLGGIYHHAWRLWYHGRTF